MLFGEADAATVALYAAIVGLLVAAANYIQSATKDRKDARVAKEKEAADKRLADDKAAADKRALDQAAHAITQEVKTVQKAVNGEGIGGKLDAVLRWQVDHDAQDNQRYDGLVAEILKLKGKAPEG
jgi:cell wall-associated NlpC family hydrolase